MDLQKEKTKLNETVENFANAMRDRLYQKVDDGYSGWDGDYPTEKLLSEIEDDLSKLKKKRTPDVFTSFPVEPYDALAHNQKCIDIANRAMMLWYRSKSDT